MPSGKQSKRARKVAPPPPVRGSSAGRRASPRVLIGAAAVLALVVVAIVLAVVLTRGGDDSSASESVPARGSLTNALPGAVEVNGALAGIPQRGNELGSAKAPATLVEYIDLQCPFCRDFETEVMPDLIKTYVRPGKLKVVARLLAFIGVDSGTGRDAAIAAGRQNKLFNFSQLLYLNQGQENTGWLDDSMIQSAAASIPGLDVQQLLTDSDSPAVTAAGKAYDTAAQSDQVTATPTLLVGSSAATATPVTLSSATDKDAVVAAIERELRASS
jgi:protein-disulfide isomerase